MTRWKCTHLRWRENAISDTSGNLKKYQADIEDHDDCLPLCLFKASLTRSDAQTSGIMTFGISVEFDILKSLVSYADGRNRLGIESTAMFPRSRYSKK
jgi:hypothetical protein